MTEEQKRISDRNRYHAWKYFVNQGLIDITAPSYTYVLHHKDPSWRHEDIERYIQWNIEDLEVEKHSEHSSFHNKGKQFSEEHKKHLSESMKGHVAWNKGLTKETDERVKKNAESIKNNHPDFSGENNPRYGVKLSQQTKDKISNSLKGHKQSADTAAKRSASMKGKNTGKKTDETKEKIRQAKLGQHWKLVDGKRVYYAACTEN